MSQIGARKAAEARAQAEPETTVDAVAFVPDGQGGWYFTHMALPAHLLKEHTIEKKGPHDLGMVGALIERLIGRIAVGSKPR